MYSILIVEDTREIHEKLCALLDDEGFATDVATTKKDAVEKLEDPNNKYDIALVDLLLPDGYGMSIIETASKSNVPVIILTALDDEFNSALSLNTGAADYVAKAYRPKELIARIHKALRNSGKMRSEMKIRDLRVDMAKAVAYKGDQELYLTRIEYCLLLVFMRKPGQIISRESLSREIWGISGEWITDNTLSVHIGRLRKKLEDDIDNPQYIQTIRSMGYKMDE